MVVIFILIVMCMRVIQSVNSKKAAVLMPSGLRAYIKYTAVYMGFAAMLGGALIVVTRDFSGFNLLSLVIATCSGLFLAIGVLCGMKALLGGTMVLNSVFGTAGLLVPCIAGIFLFDEPLSLVQCVCIGVVLISAVMLIDSSKSISGGFTLKTFIYLLISFFSNGMTMLCQKLFGKLMPDGNVAMFSVLTFLIPAIMLFVMMFFVKDDTGVDAKFPKKLVACAFYLAFAVFVIQQLVTMLTPIINSAVLFTLVNGGGTVITAIVGALVYREKITLKSFFGIVLGVGALIVINAF